MRRVILALAIALLAADPGIAKQKKSRAWQEGEVSEIQRPGDGAKQRGGTLEPHIGLRPGMGTVITPHESSFGTSWALIIDLPEASYIVTLPPPPSKSSLAKLAPGDRVSCAAEGKTLYLRDAKGRELRTRIRHQSDPEPK